MTEPERDAHSNPSATIRAVRREDVPSLKAVIDATELFPSELLDDMLAGFFSGEARDELWLTDDDGGAPLAVAYCAPERMTDGTWNVLAMAVHPDHQGHGRGAASMRRIKQALTARGERLLLVETSGLPSFERTRAFYRGCGYEEEARIRDFYEAGDDKVIFRKTLT